MLTAQSKWARRRDTIKEKGVSSVSKDTSEMLRELQLAGCDITRSAVAKIEVGQRHVYPDEIILLKQILNAEYHEILQ